MSHKTWKEISKPRSFEKSPYRNKKRFAMSSPSVSHCSRIFRSLAAFAVAILVDLNSKACRHLALDAKITCTQHILHQSEMPHTHSQRIGVRACASSETNTKNEFRLQLPKQSVFSAFDAPFIVHSFLSLCNLWQFWQPIEEDVAFVPITCSRNHQSSAAAFRFVFVAWTSFCTDQTTTTATAAHGVRAWFQSKHR